MEPDIIEQLAKQAVEAVEANNVKKVLVLLGEIQGQAAAAVSLISTWDLVREDYEGGVKPRELVRRYHRYGVTLKEIYNRSYSGNWASPTKLKKAIRKTTASKNTFYPNCKHCDQPFEATSGHAIICPTCKAFKALDKGEKRVKGRGA